jgi:OOP family OmpA-OmpF porin
MNTNFKKTLTDTLYGLCSALLLTLPSAGAGAADMGITGYLVDTGGGSVVYTSRGECVHTSAWKPSLAVPGCDNYVEKMEPAAAAPVQVAAAPPKRLEMVTLDARTLFGFDKAELRPEAKQVLDDMAQRLNGYPDVTQVVISGYTDLIGTEAYNKELSRRRAQAVADYLSARTDVSRTGIEVRAMGEADPLVECHNTGSFKAQVECLQPNRRVTVDVRAKRYE